jgi:hypothetical protein
LRAIAKFVFWAGAWAMVAPIAAASTSESTAGIQAQAPLSPPGPVDATKLAAARKIIATAYPPDYEAKLLGPVMQQLMGRIRAGMQLPPGFDDRGLHKILTDFLDSMPQRFQPVMEQHFPLVMDAFAHAYAREFSSEDLAAILAFAGTPAGRHYFVKSSEIMADPDVGNAMSALIRDSQVTSQQEMMAMQQQVHDYLIKRPDVARKLGAASEAAKTKTTTH